MTTCDDMSHAGCVVTSALADTVLHSYCSFVVGLLNIEHLLEVLESVWELWSFSH